jgi:hypothetical protein
VNEYKISQVRSQGEKIRKNKKLMKDFLTMALGLDRSRIGLSGYYQATGAMRLIVSVKAKGSFRMPRISTASCWRRSAYISVLLDCSSSEVLPFKTGNASPRSSYVSKTSDQVHFYDPKGALSGGDRTVVGVPNFGPDEGQVAGLVGGLGQAGKRAFLGWGQVLKVRSMVVQLKPGSSRDMMAQAMVVSMLDLVIIVTGTYIQIHTLWWILLEDLTRQSGPKKNRWPGPAIFYYLISGSYIFTAYFGVPGIVIASSN